METKCIECRQQGETTWQGLYLVHLDNCSLRANYPCQKCLRFFEAEEIIHLDSFGHSYHYECFPK